MTLKIGWIGCGIHATQMLLPQLVRHDVQVTALCDIDGNRLAAAGRQFGVSNLTSDAEELIRRTDIDAVGMAVGPDQHRSVATRLSPEPGVALEEGDVDARTGRHGGGGGGIRTLGAGVTHTTVFETAPFNHSGTPPRARPGRG